MRPSGLFRRAVATGVVVIVSALGAVPAGAASTHSFEDPRGDVEGDAGPVSQPEADIVRVAAERVGDQLTMRLWVDRPTDPRTHPAWAGATMVVWGLDTNGDEEPEAIVSYYRADDGSLVAEVDRAGGAGAPVCQASPQTDGASYGAVFAASCVGEAQGPLRYAAAMMWDTDPADENAPLVGDAAPQDGLAGPLNPEPGSGGGGPDYPDPSYRPEDGGYWLVARDGGIFSFGNAAFWGSTGDIRLNQPIVGMAADPDGSGYWFVAADGGVFAFGAPFFGSTGSIRLNKPIVGMAPTPTGLGYWLVASDGGIFSFGDAAFLGSTGDIRLNSPIVGMAASPSGNGYRFVAADGGVFSFGDARFQGSAGGKTLAHPIVGMATAPSGSGYWLVDRGGGIWAYGSAAFHGAAEPSSHPVVGISPARDGQGYSIVRSDGSVANRGSAPRAGSLRGRPLNQPVVGMAAS